MFNDINIRKEKRYRGATVFTVGELKINLSCVNVFPSIIGFDLDDILF